MIKHMVIISLYIYLFFFTETRGYSFEKMKPKENNKSYHTTNNDAYSMMNNQFKNNTNEIMKNLNKFKETNEYIQQKYDFSDINKRNEEEGSEKVKIDQLIIVNIQNTIINTVYIIFIIYKEK